MSKKTIIIIVSVAGILALGFGFYYYYFFIRNNQGTTPTDNPSFPITDNTSGGTNTKPTGGTDGNTNEPSQNSETLKLRQLTKKAVAGATFVPNADHTVRFVEKGEGNIFETSATTASSETRITNTTISRVHEVLWGKAGDVVIRYVSPDGETTQTVYGSIKTTGAGEKKLEITPIGTNISEVALSPALDTLFYLQPKDGSSALILSKINGANKVQISESPLREWLLAWPNVGTIILTTKPEAGSEGVSYSLNAKNYAELKIIGGIKGLTVLPNATVSWIVYGEAKNNLYSLNVMNMKTREIQNIGFGFPEKCVWSKRDESVVFCAIPQSLPLALYPNVWYQGLVSFTDSMVKINVVTGSITPIDSLKPDVKGIDAVSMTLNRAEDSLIFINKKDTTLWALSL